MGKRILFIHHSTGGNLIKEGDLRGEIKRLNSTLEFWDHSYNLYEVFPILLANVTHHKGLSNYKGDITGIDYNINLSNNSPKEYAELFSRDTSDSTLKLILSYDVIAFKNCYPTTKLKNDEQLNSYFNYYNQIKERLMKYETKQFLILTPPPLRKETTTPENAKRAIRLAQGLCSKEFLNDIPNISSFDLFSLLSDEFGFLRKDYTRLLPFDSHPNKKANRSVAPIFAQKIVEVARRQL